MDRVGYLIRYRPYVWDEDVNGNMIHNHRADSIEEFFTDENKFKARITQLENVDCFQDSNGGIYDGIDIDELYTCELHRIK